MSAVTTALVMLSAALLSGPAHATDPAYVQQGARVVATDATRAPRSDAMIGAACSYRTAVMARRVLSDGADYAFVGSLQAGQPSDGDVACPYTVGGQADTCVIASELVEHLAGQGLGRAELSLEGRILEVDGVRYVVLTAYEPSSS